MLRDLQRMNERGDGQLNGRATTDQDMLAEMAFRHSHGGMSRADYAERQRQWAADDAKAAVLAGYDGEPPSTIVSSAIDALSATPQRARLARFMAWRDSVAGELAALKVTRDRLQAAIDAPESLKAKRSGLLREQANRLLEFIGLGKNEATSGFDVLERRTLDAELDQAEHKSEVARIAIADIGKQIATKEVQLAYLIKREKEFVRPALRERAELYIPAYAAAIEKLREAIAPLAGLQAHLHGKGVDIDLPEFGSLKKSDIRIHECNDAPWREFERSLGATLEGGFYVAKGTD